MKLFITLFFAAGVSALHSAPDRSAEIDGFTPSDTTVTDVTPLVFSIPAPRGQILDRSGRPLARMAVKSELTVSIPQLDDESESAFVAALEEKLSAAPEGLKEHLLDVDTVELEQHFAQRRRVPVVISPPLDNKFDAEALKLAADAGFGKREIYLREYPYGSLAAHILGNLTTVGPPLTGPVRQKEFFWKDSKGSDGIELTFDEQLRGKPGLMVLGFDENASETARDILEPPVPGANVFLTLDLEVQQAVEAGLAEAGRPGAAVVLNAKTGEILAMASYPTFNPNDFVPAISSADYQKLTGDMRNPLFNRASGAAYPPGSVFKPVVGLAALGSGAISANTMLDCRPTLEISGRIFKNWSDSDSGRFNMRGALIRSCNTYFYQIALRTGDEPILNLAEVMGFAQKPPIPLPGVVAGSMPSAVPSPHGLANLSIGQGEVLASPLQVASMMGAMCVMYHRASPQLLAQVQTQDGQITMLPQGAEDTPIHHYDEDFRYIRSGMYGVVNHQQGTATKVRQEYVPICGKTGTAQWSNNGKMASAVWFSGFVPNSTPPISYTVLLEGNPGERIFGGSTAGPVAAKFLREIFAKGKIDAIKSEPRSTPYRIATYPVISTAPVAPVTISAPRAQPVSETQVEQIQDNEKRRFFKRRLFRRR